MTRRERSQIVTCGCTGAPGGTFSTAQGPPCSSWPPGDAPDTATLRDFAPDIDPKFMHTSRRLNSTDTTDTDRGSMRSRDGKSTAPATGLRSRLSASTHRHTASRQNIALVAHDKKKGELLDWARSNRSRLATHELFATSSTGGMLRSELGLAVAQLQSGPLGGDVQIGARIVEGVIGVLIFFWDPLEPQPHDSDVKALLRIAVVWNIPVACNRASADCVISSCDAGPVANPASDLASSPVAGRAVVPSAGLSAPG